MAGERDLGVLLARMQPHLEPDDYCFCLLPPGAAVPGAAIASVREAEGVTAVMPANQTNGLDVRYRCRKITLRVHSDLEAVGLTAAVSRVLAESGISCNVIAGVFHDHIFVPADRAQEALQSLLALSST